MVGYHFHLLDGSVDFCADHTDKLPLFPKIRNSIIKSIIGSDKIAIDPS